MKELGKEHFLNAPLEKYPCNDIEELRAREGEWIEKKSTLNMRVAGRTPEQYRKDTVEHKKEYDKQRREDKREESGEQQKAKYENKKEHYKQKSNENYFKNKEAIRTKMNVKCNCECGMVYSYGNRLRHFKSKTHQNYLNKNINSVQVSQEEQEGRNEGTSSEIIA